METDVTKHSGSKYLRKVYSATEQDKFVTADVYSVLEAFNTVSAPVDHAIKKLLCAGIRGKGDLLQDLKEARDAISRAIQIEENKVTKCTTLDFSGILKDSFIVRDCPKFSLDGVVYTDYNIGK